MLINIVAKGHFIVSLFVELSKSRPPDARFGVGTMAKALDEKLIIYSLGHLASSKHILIGDGADIFETRMFLMVPRRRRARSVLYLAMILRRLIALVSRHAAAMRCYVATSLRYIVRSYLFP